MEDLLALFQYLVQHPKLGALVAGVIYVLVNGLIERSRRQRTDDELPSRQPEPELWRAPQAEAPPPRPLPVLVDVGAQARARLSEEVLAISRRAQALAEEVELEPANRRFVDTLRGYLPSRADQLRVELAEARGPFRPAHAQIASELLLVLQELEELVRQRRDRTLLPMVGDADALAEACYRPVITFAKAEGLPLSSAAPAAQLGDFELSIWVGFAPTSVAPLFLPPDFFQRLAWWPALAHEMGHDFLISIPGLKQRLCAELRLPAGPSGSVPLRFSEQGLTFSELQRIHGGWIEELFCDVFGTLMLGPAYLATMGELFASEDDPRSVQAIFIDRQTGLYDEHPPRHLRMHACRLVLERAGFSAEAALHLARWNARHGFQEGSERILVPSAAGYVGLPLEPFLVILKELVERLQVGPLEGLSGFGLSDISGLSYGAHSHAQALRARDALLAGGIPAVADARAIISGAVYALLQRPELEAAFLQRARAAIPALGTYEMRTDGLALARDQGPGSGPLPLGPQAIREALMLREILQRPGNRRRLSSPPAPRA